MNFWKRLSLIASAALVVLWLAIVAVGLGASTPSVPRNCVANCL
jgi:hypothetical protein